MDSEENVMKLIVKPKVEYQDPPMYQSKFRKSVRRASAGGKSAHKTFGLSRVSLNPPTQFLRKHSRVQVKQTNVKHKHYHIPDYQHKLPAWNPKNIAETPKKDFKKENITKVKSFEAKKSKLYFVDDRYGNSFPQKPNRYSISASSKDKNLSSNLKKNQDQKKKSTETKKIDSTKVAVHGDLSKSDQKSQLNQSKEENMCRYVMQEERLELLTGMKKRWEDLMKQFQGLPFLTDTPSKVKRKAKMEQDLKELEKDIDMVERHSHIYVYNNENNN